MPVLHAVRVRPQGTTAWTVRESGIPEGTSSHTLTGLAAGVWEEQVGVYLDTETVADATWSTTRTFTRAPAQPNAPSILAAAPTVTAVTLSIQAYSHPDAVVAHAAGRRIRIIRTADSTAVLTTPWLSGTPTTYTTGEVLQAATYYTAQAEDRDANGAVSGWGPAFPFLTAASSGTVGVGPGYSTQFDGAAAAQPVAGWTPLPSSALTGTTGESPLGKCAGIATLSGTAAEGNVAYWNEPGEQTSPIVRALISSGYLLINASGTTEAGLTGIAAGLIVTGPGSYLSVRVYQNGTIVHSDSFIIGVLQPGPYWADLRPGGAGYTLRVWPYGGNESQAWELTFGTPSGQPTTGKTGVYSWGSGAIYFFSVGTGAPGPGPRPCLGCTPLSFTGRLLVEDAAGTMREYYPRALQATMADHVDQPTASATFTIAREADGGSVAIGAFDSPLNQSGGAYAPALYAGRRIVYQEPDASMPGGYLPIFDGHLHSVDDSAQRLTLTANDLALRLQRYKIQETRIYGEARGTPVEYVMQQMLDDNEKAGDWGLRVLGTPDWQIRTYEQLKMVPLAEAQTSLAQSFGWVVRWWRHDDTAAFCWTLLHINPNKTLPDFTFQAGEHFRIDAHGISDKDVKNDILVSWYDGDDYREKLYSDLASQQKFGVLPGEINEGTSSAIDTEAEADRLGEAALAALADPLIEGTRAIPYTPRIRLGDLIRFHAWSKVHTQPVDMAVVAWRHEISMQGTKLTARTVVDLRGRPTGMHKRWLRSLVGAAEEGQPPVLHVDVGGTATSGTLWWKIQTRGIGVTSVRAQRKVGTGPWSALETPLRGAGAPSAVKGGILGKREYEHDVQLVGNDISQILANIYLASGEILTIGPYAFDADIYPAIINITITGNSILVECDTDTKSIRAERVNAGGGTAYLEDKDGMSATFTPSIPAGESWDILITAYSDTIAGRTAGTLTTTRQIRTGGTSDIKVTSAKAGVNELGACGSLAANIIVGWTTEKGVSGYSIMIDREEIRDRYKPTVFTANVAGPIALPDPPGGGFWTDTWAGWSQEWYNLVNSTDPNQVVNEVRYRIRVIENTSGQTAVNPQFQPIQRWTAWAPVYFAPCPAPAA